MSPTLPRTPNSVPTASRKITFGFCIVTLLDAAQEASLFIQGKTRESLNTGRMLALSLVMLLEIIGEAASRVSREKQAQVPEIPWRQIIGMKNRVSHLKQEKLVLDWRNRQQSRAAVKLAIEEVLDQLPESYCAEVYSRKCNEVYEHIYESYSGVGHSIYSFPEINSTIG
ncbi:MAG: DUF86 domain-containing protein [Symploca sp. SIO2E9]|nr:DUF86 domain-containing protein [Symploca sp. SIO2E9]